MKLTQNTNDWHKWRHGGLGASEAPAVMGVSPWKSYARLLWEKTSPQIVHQAQTPWMKRGHDLEPIARRIYSNKYYMLMPPACMEHEEDSWRKASLDGHNKSAQIDIEIKVPNAKDHESARLGKVPDKYIYQIQHALMVSGSKELHYISYNGNTHHVVQVKPDVLIQNRLLREERAFWKLVEEKKLCDLKSSS